MPRTTGPEGDFDQEDDYTSEEFEYSPEADDPGVFWCPRCGAEMYGGASRCPKCGDYVTPGARPRRSMPWWMWAGLILVVLTLVAGLLAVMWRPMR